MKEFLKQFYLKEKSEFLKYKYFIYELVCILIILISYSFLTIEENALKQIFIFLVLGLGFGNLVFIRIKGRF